MTVEQAKTLITAIWMDGTFEGVQHHTGLDRRDASNAAAALRRLGIALPALKSAKGPKQPSVAMSREQINDLKRYSKACEIAQLNKERREPC